MSETKTGRRTIKIALAGNPNSGKTSIFNCLTGANQKVANFPGVTVEKKVGVRKYGEYDITFVDLPGTYSLTAYSLDEKVAREFILNENPDVIVNVIDSGNLERSLYLTTQLIEMGVHIVIDLNMWDEARESGIDIDTDKLSELLGAPVVKTIASRSQGIDNLLDTAIGLTVGNSSCHRHPPVSYGPKLDDIVNEISCEISTCKNFSGCGNPRWLAVRLLEGDSEIKARCIPPDDPKNPLNAVLDKSVNHLKSTNKDDIELIITEGRYGYVAGITREVIKRPPLDRMKMSGQVDNILTHRWFGYPIFILMMYLIFEATFTLGAYPMEWIEGGVSWLQGVLVTTLPAGMFRNLMTDGIIGGVGFLIVFLPNIVILFLGISLLEDSGYMARAAFLMDKLMHYLGLHGKSFVPMLMGFGCAIPAIMATRTLESDRDRIMTIMLIPLMSCSARLPVYILFAGAFFGAGAGIVIFSMYLLGIVAAVIIARIMQKTILKSDDAPFVMELPPYRWPTFSSVLIHMWERTRIYLKKMGGIILVASIILWALGYFPRKENYSVDYDSRIAALSQQENTGSSDEITQLENMRAAEDLEYSLIGRIGSAIAPLVKPLGFNWQMGVSLVPGFIAKEIVISSLGVLYNLGEDEGSDTLVKSLTAPSSGITPLTALAYMVFVLLYTPCLSTVVITRKEAGWKWMWLSIVSQTVLAYVSALAVYRIGQLLGFG